MIGLPSFAGEFCADQDNADGAASDDLETNAGWSSSEESDDSESAAIGGTPSRQKHPPRVSRIAFGASARARLHGKIDAAAQVLDAGTHAGAGTKSPGRVGANKEWSSAAAGAAVPARTPATPREASSSSSSQSLTHRIKNVGQTPDRQGPFTIEPSEFGVLGPEQRFKAEKMRRRVRTARRACRKSGSDCGGGARLEVVSTCFRSAFTRFVLVIAAGGFTGARGLRGFAGAVLGGGAGGATAPEPPRRGSVQQHKTSRLRALPHRPH
jgi:hypothetical protein